MGNKDTVTEANEHFDVILYPEKEENIEYKQGLTIKGSSDEFKDALRVWMSILENKDSNDRVFLDTKFKLSSFKPEKYGTRCNVTITKMDKSMICILSIFKSGTVLILEKKPSDITAVLEFSLGVFIPIIKAFLSGQMDITTFEALVWFQDSPNSFTQCGTPCSSQKI